MSDQHNDSQTQTPSPETWHSRVMERKSGILAVATTVVILIGGIVEIAPMYTVQANAPEAGMPVYTPLELAGRDIYIREGCYNCHSQMIRPMVAEVLRYGEWSRAGEYVHDRPFQLGSRRIGPDLHRVGGKYPDAWHYQHMLDPRSTTPESIMPPYPWLFGTKLDMSDVAATVSGFQTLAGGYDRTDVASVTEAVRTQGGAIVENLRAANLTAEPDEEIVAVIAYLQRLGTDFSRLQGVTPDLGGAR